MRKLSQRDRFEMIRAYGQTLGLHTFLYWRCGCMAGKFQDGKKRRIKCERHKHKYPRTCPCGHNDHLCARTAYYHRLGDEEMVEKLRKERTEHAKDCYRRAS